jgi:hypothetical protein
MRHDGGLLMALGAGLALILSIWNFFAPVELLAPTASIAGTPAAGLAIVATLALFLAALVLAGSASNRWLVALLLVGTLVGILGTGFTGRLIESPLLVGLMALCFVGWLIRLFAPRARY